MGRSALSGSSNGTRPSRIRGISRHPAKGGRPPYARCRTTLVEAVRQGCYLAAMELKSVPVKSNDVRVPKPEVGSAYLVERYSADSVKAVILHPDDFAELQSRAQMLEEAARPAGLELSEIEVKAHRIAESREGEVVEDEAAVRSLLGL